MQTNGNQKRFLFGLIIALIGLVYGLFDYLYVTSLHPEHVNFAELVNHALVVILLLFCLEFLYEVLRAVEDFTSESRLGTSRLIETCIQNNKGIIGDLLKTLYTEVENTLQPSIHNTGFIVSHDVLAIYSYEDFWNLLVSEQERRQRNQETPLHVQIIHSCEINIWTGHDLTSRLIGYQKKFHDAGGNVARIFCRNESSPNEAILDAAKNMRDANIDVFYYDVSKAAIDFRFTWDFLHVTETGVSVIWESFGKGPGGVIERSIYQRIGSYGGKDLGTLWNQIRQKSTEIP